MKYHIINSSFNEVTGISTVTISCKYGNFTGTARLNSEDLDYKSQYFGCKVAEVRAKIEVWKYRINELNTVIATIDNIYNQLSTDPEYKYAVSKVKKQYSIKVAERQELQKRIKNTNKEINAAADTHIKNIKKLREVYAKIRKDKLS